MGRSVSALKADRSAIRRHQAPSFAIGRHRAPMLAIGRHLPQEVKQLAFTASAADIAEGDFGVGSFATDLVPVGDQDLGTSDSNWGSVFAGNVVCDAIGVGTEAPESGLRVAVGDALFENKVTINGPLEVNGNINYVTRSDLRVEDRNITLATSDEPSDSNADGAGLIVMGSGFLEDDDRALSFTWNANASGNQWLARGGTLAVEGSSNNVIQLRVTDGGDLSIEDDDGNGVSFDMSLVPAGSNQLGTESNAWDALYVDSATVNGSLESSEVTIGDSLTLAEGATTSLSAALLPGSNDSFDLGEPSTAWRSLYAGSATLSSTLEASGATLTGDLILGSNSLSCTGDVGDSSNPVSSLFATEASIESLTILQRLVLEEDSETSLGADLLPASNAAYDLGATSNAWKSLFVDHLVGSDATLTGGLTVHGITLSAPLVLGSNPIIGSGEIATSEDRASALYCSVCDVDTLSVNSNLVLGENSTTSLSADLMPGADATYDVGSSDSGWKSVAASTVACSNLSVLEGGSATFATSLLPDPSSNYDLGSPSNAWDSIFAREAILSGDLSARGATFEGDLDLGSNSLACTGSVGASSEPLSSIFAAEGSIQSLAISDSLSLEEGTETSLAAHLLPGGDFTYDLGASSNAWRSLYVKELKGCNATFTGGITMSGQIASSNSRASALYSSVCDVITARVNGSFAIGPGSTTSISAGLTPGTDATYDLGSASNGWRGVRASSVGCSNLSILAGGSATFSSSLTPGSNNVYDIGSAASTWRNVYASNITVTGSLTLSSNAAAASQGSANNRVSSVYASIENVDSLMVNSDLTLSSAAYTSFGCPLIPSSNGSLDVGSSSRIWRTMYASNASLSGALTAAGGITSSNGLTVAAGAAMFASNASVSGSLTSAGLITSSNGLTVAAGAATFASTLSVQGAATFASSASVGGSLTSAGLITSSNGLNVASGAATFASNLSVQGAATFASSASVGGSLTSAGLITSSNGLTVAAGAAAFASTLSVQGAATFASSASVSGSLTSACPITSSNGLTVAAGAATFASNLSVQGAATFASSASVSGSLTSAGLITSSNGLTVAAGAATFASSVSVSGSLTSAGLLTSSNGLNVAAGAATLSSNLSVQGSLVSVSGITSSNGLTVAAGAATFGGSASVSGSLTSAGLITSSNGLNVAAGAATFASSVSVSGSLTSAGLLTSSNGLNVAAGAATFASNLSVQGSLVSVSGITSSNGLTVAAGNASFAGTLSASNAISGSSFATTGAVTAASGSFSGDVTVNGTLMVGGRVDYINTSDLLVADKNITLASSSNSTDALASGAGIYIQGTNYANSNSTISLTWNTGQNGNYWLPKGGNLALPGTSGSKMVTLSTTANGSLQLLSDDGITATTTASLGSHLLAASSSLDIGSTSTPWGTVYATSIGSSSKVVPVYASSVNCSNVVASGAVSAASLSLGTGALSCGNLTSAGTLSLGSLSGTSTSAVGPYVVSAGFDAVGSNHSIPAPPGGRNQAGILHVFCKESEWGVRWF